MTAGANTAKAGAPDMSAASRMAMGAPLPFIDEHSVIVAAGTESVWIALSRVVDRSFSGTGKALFAHVLGCADLSSSDEDTLARGATRPGFHVSAAIPGRELSLEGRHRFSRYALSFHIQELDSDRTRLSAETRARFPGLHGRSYRALIIGTGGHVLVVHHMLAAVKRAAERSR